MGQYYVIANLDKREFISPSSFLDGVKLMEFSLSGNGVLSGLSVLLASSNGEGGGDLDVESSWDDIPGRWAGDRIVVAGDYDNNKASPGFGIYDMCGERTDMEQLLQAGGQLDNFVDISSRVLGALLCDDWFRQQFTHLPEGAGREYFDRRQREAWAAARPGETFPRDIQNHNNI
jgi:hypothetical protein